jgi:membrane-bound serine protease (ClpP class)
MAPAVGFSSDKKPVVLIMEIRNEIDPRMSRYVSLALEEALRVKADAVLIDMDTYGGAVNDADKIRMAILEHPKPVYVYINKNAASAGALISIACDSIYMEPGSNIGAATVVTGDGKAAPDKYQSYMRSMMRSTAEANGRDPSIAEQMVDESLSIDSVTKKGRVITLTTKEAIEKGFCEAEVTSIEAILARTGLENAEQVRFSLDGTEQIISIFLNPVVSGILLLVIIGGIYFELQTPGIGFPSIAAVVAAILYFVPYYLNGLAENWEILLFVVGIVLIAVEVFVIPGFGVAGISGIAFCCISLVLVMLDNDAFDFTFVEGERIVNALLVLLSGLLGGIVLIAVGGLRLANSSFMRKVALQSTQAATEGYVANQLSKDLIGKTGVASTTLRPSGKVMIEGEVYDAYSRGEFIEKGTKVEVMEEGVNSLKVRPL